MARVSSLTAAGLSACRAPVQHAVPLPVGSDTIIPGVPARVRFTPEKSGTFPFLCDIFCGDGHESMSGTIVVA